MKTIIVLVILAIVAIAIFQLFNKESTREEVKDDVFDNQMAVKSKAYQVEAMQQLRAAANKQMEYHAVHGTYTDNIADFSGFMGKGSDKHKISIVSADANSFTIRAEGNIDNDKRIDIIEINEDGQFDIISNDLEWDE